MDDIKGEAERVELLVRNLLGADYEVTSVDITRTSIDGGLSRVIPVSATLADGSRMELILKEALSEPDKLEIARSLSAHRREYEFFTTAADLAGDVAMPALGYSYDATSGATTLLLADAGPQGSLPLQAVGAGPEVAADVVRRLAQFHRLARARPLRSPLFDGGWTSAALGRVSLVERVLDGFVV